MAEYFVRARVSKRADAGWKRVAHDHGVTVSALVEAIGLAMRLEADLHVRELVDAARRIDTDRRAAKRRQRE